MSTSPSVSRSRFPVNLQAFQTIVRAFLSELDAEELHDAHADYTAFMSRFPAAEQAEAFVFYWNHYCGFHCFEREYRARLASDARKGLAYAERLGTLGLAEASVREADKALRALEIAGV